MSHFLTVTTIDVNRLNKIIDVINKYVTKERLKLYNITEHKHIDKYDQINLDKTFRKSRLIQTNEMSTIRGDIQQFRAVNVNCWREVPYYLGVFW